MTKSLLALTVASLFIFSGCGTSGEEIIRSGTIEELSERIKKKSTPNELTSDSTSLLALAIREKKNDMALYLYDSCSALLLGTETDNPYLYSAISDNLEFLETLLNEDDIIPLTIRDSLLTISFEKDWVEIYTKLRGELSVVKTIRLLSDSTTAESPSIYSHYRSGAEYEIPLDFDNISYEINSRNGSHFRSRLSGYHSDEFAIVDLLDTNGEMSIKLSSGQQFIRAYRDILSEPIPGSMDGSDNTLRTSYFRNVVLGLPDFVPSLYSHKGYYSGDREGTNQLPFILHRISRSPEVLTWLWKSWGSTLFQEISTEYYVNNDFAKTTEGLLKTWDMISSKEHFRDSLIQFFDTTESVHINSTPDMSYGLVESYPRNPFHLWHGDFGVDQYWAVGFWMRRINEGNEAVVLDILREIDGHYKSDPDYFALCEFSVDKEILERYRKRAGETFDITAIRKAIYTGSDLNNLEALSGAAPIAVALLNNDLDTVAKMINDSSSYLFTSNYNGRQFRHKNSLYHYAVTTEAIDMLHSHGVSLVEEGYHVPIAERFIRERQPKLLEKMIEIGADVTRGGKYVTSYFYFVSIDYPDDIDMEILLLLLNSGANPYVDRDGEEMNTYEVASVEVREIMDAARENMY